MVIPNSLVAMITAEVAIVFGSTATELELNVKTKYLELEPVPEIAPLLISVQDVEQ